MKKDIIMLFVLCFSLLCSCRTQSKIEYRDRDVNHYIVKTVHDTLIDKTTDSVYVEVVSRNDTVFCTKYKEKTRWRDKIVERHDTIWRDSVVTEYKEITKEDIKIHKFSDIFLIFGIIITIFAFIKLFTWYRMR